MTERTFTLEEARSKLPTVRMLAERMVRVHAGLEGAAKALDPPEMECIVPLGYFRLLEAMRTIQASLAREGVMVKDTQRGLLDFPALYGGRIVLLCWKVGEDDIGYWHELDTGFSGRRPISELPDATRPD
ncbi:MAG: DUF2203 domain-containing protein [Acidobacteriota bacterium]